jgi:hypothetical protein
MEVLCTAAFLFHYKGWHRFKKDTFADAVLSIMFVTQTTTADANRS